MLVQPNDAQSAEFTSLAVFHTAIGRAQYVIDTSDLSSINQTYDGWLNTGGFTTSSDVYNEAFISDKNVYRTDGLVNTNGYSGKWDNLAIFDQKKTHNYAYAFLI